MSTRIDPVLTLGLLSYAAHDLLATVPSRKLGNRPSQEDDYKHRRPGGKEDLQLLQTGTSTATVVDTLVAGP